MEVGKRIQVAIKRNAKDEIEECLECEIVGVDKYKAYKKESSVLQAKQLKEKENRQKARDEFLMYLEKRLFRQNLLVAKVYFDNEVDKGLCETNEEFEQAFNNFIYKGTALEIEKAPKEYQAILERLA